MNQLGIENKSGDVVALPTNNDARWKSYLLHWTDKKTFTEFCTILDVLITSLSDLDDSICYFLLLDLYHPKISVKATLSTHLKLISKCRSLFEEPIKGRKKVSLKIQSAPLIYQDAFRKDYNQAFLQQMSLQSVKILFKEKPLPESILLYSLYLHIGWIKMRNLVTGESIPRIILKGYCWFNISTISQTDHLYYQQKYGQNKLFINDLFSTLMSDESQELARLPYWMKDWLTLCMDKLYEDSISNFNREYLNEINYFLIPDLINCHLGISKKQRFLICFYLNKVIAENNRRL